VRRQPAGAAVAAPFAQQPSVQVGEVGGGELLQADAAEVGRDVQAGQLAMALDRAGVAAD
jgi:hypothetical protein